MKKLYDWKKVDKPDVPIRVEGWLDDGTMKLLREVWKSVTNPLIMELGSWLGLSALFFLREFEDSHVICIDHWKGSEEHQDHELVKEEKLFDTFLVNVWEYRNRLTILKSDTVAGMQAIRTMQIKPGLIYVDASHDRKSVFQDIITALVLFPEAKIVGHDFGFSSVRDAVITIANWLDWKMTIMGLGWALHRR